MDLLCPACASALPAENPEIRCPGCGRSFPVVVGIPDLRLVPDPYIEFAEDREKAALLDSEAGHLDLAGLVRRYFELTPEVPPRLAARHAHGMLRLGPARAHDRLTRLAAETGVGPGVRRVIDVGCGAGAWLPALCGRFPEVVGVDVALRWLVVARKALVESGSSAELLCANAEHLPLPPGCAQLVVVSNVVEHLRDVDAAFAALFAALDKDGVAYLTAPNRFSLLPDPHVGIPGIGFLPVSWADDLVRYTKGIPYEGIRPLGALSLTSGLSAAGFRRVEVRAAALGPEEIRLLGRKARLGARALGVASETVAGGALLKMVGPMLEVFAFKGPNRNKIAVGASRGLAQASSTVRPSAAER